MSARAAASEEPHSLLVEGTRVDLVLRRSARRSFTLQVDHRGARVSVPLRTPLGEVERFVHSHGPWLLDRLRARAQARLADVEARIAELQKMRRGLRKLVAACPGDGALDHCPILAALDGKEST